jgi:hypothetical protein
MKVNRCNIIFFLFSGLSLFSESVNAQQVFGTIIVEPARPKYAVDDTIWVTYSWPKDVNVGSISWKKNKETQYTWFREDGMISKQQNGEGFQFRTGLICMEEGKINLTEIIHIDGNIQMVWQGEQQLIIHPQKVSHQFDNLFQNTSATVRSRKSSVGSKDVFISIELSKPIVFIGEEVVISYYVMSSAQFTPGNLFLDEIRFAYKWEDENQAGEKLQESIVAIAGRRYFKNLIKRIHIFPQVTGTLDVGKGYMEGVANIPIRDNSLDAQLARISGQELVDTQQVQITCPSKTLEVIGSNQLKPGQEFLTGSYILTTNTSDTVLKLQTPLLYTLRIEGFGNLKYMRPLLFSDSTNWEIEAPLEKDSFYVKDGRIYGFREYQFTLTPIQAGRIQLPPVRLACLSTTTRQLEWLRPILSQIKVVDPDAKKKMRAKKEEEDQQRFWKRLLVSFAAILVGGILIWQSKRYYLNKYVAPNARIKERIRLAKLPMNQLLSEMEGWIASDNTEIFFVEDRVYKSIMQYLKARFRLNEHQLNERGITEVLQKWGCSAESMKEFSSLYNELLERNFGIRKNKQDLASLIDRVKNTVLKLEMPLHD